VSSLAEPPEGFVDVDDMAAEPPSLKMRTSVAAEVLDASKAKDGFMAPVHQKTADQKKRLKKTLLKSFLFSSLDDNDMEIVVDAMKDVQVPNGERIIKQGEDGNVLFIIESGKLDCLVAKGGEAEKVVKTCEPGDVFGELALLYNCPRAASVQATEEAMLWQLDRETFNAIVKVSAQKKRKRYEAFLAKVPLLEKMSDYERSQLADAFKTDIVEAETDLIREGEKGDKFYILETGTAVAMKKGVEVMKYQPGSYFGELALLTKKPRAATVKATSTCKLLSLDAGSFRRLLHTKDLMERSREYA